MIRVEFSSSLRKFTNGDANSLFEPSDSSRFFDALVERYPDVTGVILENDKLMPFVSMFLDGVQHDAAAHNYFESGVCIKFIMAVAGG